MTGFWMVWNENGSNPMKKHSSEESARWEAGRLAKLSPNVNFYVLKVVGKAKAVPVPAVTYAVGFKYADGEEPDIPF